MEDLIYVVSTVFIKDGKVLVGYVSSQYLDIK